MLDINDNPPTFAENYRPIVMEETAPVVTVGTFSAMDPDTLIHGPPFVFELPPCKENPTCHNGDETFSLIFDPGKTMYFHLTLNEEKFDTTTTFILMIRFVLIILSLNLVLKDLRYHLISMSVNYQYRWCKRKWNLHCVGKQNVSERTAEVLLPTSHYERHGWKEQPPEWDQHPDH